MHPTESDKIKLNCCRKIRVHKDQFVNIAAILFVLSLIGIMSNMGSYVHAEPESEFGILGNEHIHASILVKIHGDKFDFSQPAFQMKSSYIHFEASEGNTIYRHASNVPIGYLFDTLGIQLTNECYILPIDEIFCTNNDSSLKFYINDDKVSDIRNYVIEDKDRILISYGNETLDEIEKQLAELNSQKLTIVKETLPKTIIQDEPNVEWEAQRIVRDFESNSLSVASPSNEDGKIIFDYMEEFFVGHKEKFNPELVSLAPLIGGKDPYGTLDVILDDAGLKAQFYQGFVAKWKEIFKNKLRNIDYLHEQAVIQIRDLKIEEPKKEYYITELNKKAETAKDYLLLAASTALQPLEERARISEDQQSIRAELEGYSNEQLGGGCLIATATYGSELAPQVQLLREIRDNKVLKTESGFAFMVWFNQFYYSFSPTIADWERQNPVFKETVKLAITPLLTSLSILNYVDVDSEQEMLGYGIGIILMNIGMYFIGPTILIFKIRKIIPNIHY